MKILTANILGLSPHCKQAVAEELAAHLPVVLEKFAINTPLRVAHFLAQTAHESTGFTAFVENLNYSANGLTDVFPKYFRNVKASDFARQPEKIANHVYANRNGNGDEASGDGWKFRGRGLIQLTGKTNYAAFSNATGKDVIADPDYLATVDGAAESAAWFWSEHQINKAADADDIVAVTKIINGGVNGLDERKALLSKSKIIVHSIFT